MGFFQNLFPDPYGVDPAIAQQLRSQALMQAGAGMFSMFNPGVPGGFDPAAGVQGLAGAMGNFTSALRQIDLDRQEEERQQRLQDYYDWDRRMREAAEKRHQTQFDLEQSRLDERNKFIEQEKLEVEAWEDDDQRDLALDALAANDMPRYWAIRDSRSDKAEMAGRNQEMAEALEPLMLQFGVSKEQMMAAAEVGISPTTLAELHIRGQSLARATGAEEAGLSGKELIDLAVQVGQLSRKQGFLRDASGNPVLDPDTGMPVQGELEYHYLEFEEGNPEGIPSVTTDFQKALPFYLKLAAQLARAAGGAGAPPGSPQEEQFLAFLLPLLRPAGEPAQGVGASPAVEGAPTPAAAAPPQGLGGMNVDWLLQMLQGVQNVPGGPWGVPFKSP